MKGDIGMANYEKQVEQEAAYPIPISLYNCYRTVRHEKRYQEYNYSYASLLMPHCPVTVVQRYRDGVCSLLFHLFFIICHPYIPLHLVFYTCFTHFLTVPNAPSKTMLEYRCKKEMLIPLMQHALGPHRYDATLYAMLHSHLSNSAHTTS